jgi:hypothetical protein
MPKLCLFCAVLTVGSCTCGHHFCYVCGKAWDGPHGCPFYGPAVYDAEGYNQDGYHRTTDRNREGYTREIQWRIDHGEFDETDDEDDEDDEETDDYDEETDNDDEEIYSDDEDDSDEEEHSEDEEDRPALQ